MAETYVLLTAAQKSSLEAIGVRVTKAALPQTLSSVTPGDYFLCVISDYLEGTVTAAAVAPSIRAVGSQVSTASNTSITVAHGTHATGDILRVEVMCRQNATVDLTADGYARISDDTPGTSSTYLKSSRWWKRAASASEPSVTVNFGVGGPKIGRSASIQGCVASGTPCYGIGTPTNFSNTAGTSIDMPGGTISDNKSLVVMGFVTNQTAGLGSLLSGSFTNADLSSITELYTHTPGAGDIAAYVRYGVCDSAKTIAATTATITSAFRRAAYSDVFIPA